MGLVVVLLEELPLKDLGARPSSSTMVGTRSAGLSPPRTCGRFERSLTDSSRRS
jgi:hypothetical protein